MNEKIHRKKFTNFINNKKIFVVIIFLFIIGCQSNITQDIIKEKNIRAKVYFCPGEPCEEKLNEFLDSAKVSIHCALFDLDLEGTINILKEKSKQIDVKVVVDNNNYKGLENYDFIIKDTSSQYSHNKFCIIDNKKVSTGSMNPTQRGAYSNNNNLIILYSTYLAQNFEEEFKELWNKEFGEGNKVKNPIIYLNNKKIENYFCPEDNCVYHVKQTLEKANSSIYFMTFSFTHPSIANTLLLKHLNNITVKGIFEKSQRSEYSKYDFLKYQGLDVTYDSNPANMHHKVFIIDKSIVITGSFNPSKNADTNNDENILIIYDKEIAEKYLEEFEMIWNS